jgi:hypothetical protein
MRQRPPSWFRQAVIGVALGLALGFAVGWWLWPVTYTNTSPAALREDYRDDYILMVAAAYDVEGNLQEACARLEQLNSGEPAAPVRGLAERLIEGGGQEEDITRLARLARALGVADPLLTPYLEGQP